MCKIRNEATSPHFIFVISPKSQGQSQSECGHQESFTLHLLYLLTDFDVMSGSSYSLSVPGPVSLVICLVSKRWTDPGFDCSDPDFSLYPLPSPLSPLVPAVVCSRPCLPQVRGIWMEILIPWSSPPLWGVLHLWFVTGEVGFLPDPVHPVVSDRNVVKQ